MAKDILAFVGPSGSGKTTCIQELLEAFPEKIGMCMSVTTRAPRGRQEDDAMYRFVSRPVFEQYIAENAFIHSVEHAGNYYGTLRKDADTVLGEKYAVGAFVEQGVQNLRASGYTVRVIKLQPCGHLVPNDSTRAAEDAARDRIDVHPELVLVNNFAPGGRAQTLEQLFAYIRALP